MAAWLSALKLSGLIVLCCGLAVIGAIKAIDRHDPLDEHGPWGDR